MTNPARAVRTSARRGAWSISADLLLLVSLLLLTWAVHRGMGPVRLDRLVERELPSPTAPGLPDALGDAAQTIATIANPKATTGLTLLLAALVSVRTRSTTVLRRVVPPVLAVSVAVLAGKAALHRLGPPGSKPPHLLGYFPSGHTATALVCVGTLAELLGEARPHWRRRLRLLVAGWTLLVAVSMVFHRYHWVTDVTASVLLGLMILRGTSRSTSRRRAATTTG